MAAGQ